MDLSKSAGVASFLVAAMTASALAFQSRADQGTPVVAFVDVAVIPMTDAGVRPHQTVVIQDGVIAAVGEVSSVTPPAGAVVIDGRGRFLMPGLVDAHVHLMEEADLQQFLFYGVTTVRNLLGSPETLAWKRAIAARTLVGPRIVTSGPAFAGAEVPWRNKVVPTDADAARAEVRRQHDAGYDLIKIYDGISPSLYAAIASEAARLGMRMTGHIPADVHLAGVLAAKQDLEHTDKLVFDVWGHALDAARIDSIASMVRSAGVFVTPTIASMQQLARIGSGDFDALVARPEARRVGAETLAHWCGVSSRLRGNRRPGPGVRYNPWTDFQMDVVAGLQRAGVPLLAGTDYPNATLAAGSALLEEIRALADAGLTPFEALAAATTTAAKAIGDSSSGVISRGARADMVLLNANPLVDLQALEVNEGVMVAGRWFSRSELDRLAPARPSAPACAAK